MLKENVFRFRDGKGGYFYKKREEGGYWLPCDEEGNTIGEASEQVPSESLEEKAEPSTTQSKPLVPERKRPGRPRKVQESRAPSGRKTNSVHFEPPTELFIRLKDYVQWLNFGHEDTVSRNDIVTRAVEEYIARDKGYAEFIRTRKLHQI